MSDLTLTESALRAEGFAVIAGIDEAGRGPLAGPVVAACAVMSGDILADVNDSKKLSEKKRETLFSDVISHALSYGVGIIDNGRIDEINILNATKEAFAAAYSQLKLTPSLIIIDGKDIIKADCEVRAVIKGDATCYSIAAASIIAKVTRDRLMREYDVIYPQYGFAKHKGYGTAEHIAALKKYGPCPIHRASFIGHFV